MAVRMTCVSVGGVCCMPAVYNRHWVTIFRLKLSCKLKFKAERGFAKVRF